MNENHGRRTGDIVARMMPRFCGQCRTRTAHIEIPFATCPQGVVVDGIMRELGLAGEWRCGRCRRINS